MDRSGRTNVPRRSGRLGGIGAAALVVIGVGAVVCIAAVIVIWEEFLEDRFVRGRWGVVEQGLIYRSGQIDASLIESTLRDEKIKTIVNLCKLDVEDPDQNAERRAAEQMGIRYVNLGLAGNGTGDIGAYATALELMAAGERNGDPVLVHCASGTQRTGAAVAFYRLLVQGRPPPEVYDELRDYDWDPKDDYVLLDYINEHMEELARLLVERGVIPRVPDPIPQLHS
jgi:protein tyrosine phosphatase (PTP) superfamily phosphohydrolase (DUF442 family)